MARRGRDLFRRFRPAMLAASQVFRAVPEPLIDAGWNATDMLPPKIGLGLRFSIMRSRVRSCGDNVFIGRSVTVLAPEGLVIGSNVSIHAGCYIDATGGIEIASDVSIAHQCSILSTEHTWNDTTVPIRDNRVDVGPVRIADDVWIGCGARILAGVTVGSRAVVAAGAVVTKDVASHTVVAGVPARVLKSIP